MPYTFSQPFTSKDGNVELKFQFAQAETFKSYDIRTNAKIWSVSTSLDDITYTLVDSQNLEFSYLRRKFTLANEVTARYVKLNVRRVIETDPYASVNLIVFFDLYNRRINPYLTTQTKYYTSEYTTYVQPGIIASSASAQSGEVGPVYLFKFPVSVTPEYVYAPGLTIRKVNVGTGTVSIGSNQLSALSGTDIFVYYSGSTPDTIKIFDANCAPLTDSSWFGGPIRYNRDEWVEMTFEQPISANSYSFTTPSIDIYPTWFQVQGYDGAWKILDEKKHVYTPYTIFSGTLNQNKKPYNRYRIVVKAMKQKDRASAELLLFNLYDMNGCEFIKTLTFTNDGRTNAQVLDKFGFVDGVTTTSTEWIKFIVPVRIIKIIVYDLFGTVSISKDDSPSIEVTLTTRITSVDITGQKITVNVPSGSRYSSIEFYGTRGRLNPYISSDGTMRNAYGGSNISPQYITLNLPSSQTLYGNHYYIATTGDTRITSYELYGFNTGSAVQLAKETDVQSSTISGNFVEYSYDRYELQILEINANSFRGSVDIHDMTIFSNTYTPIVPQFSGASTVIISKLPISIHGVYTINPKTTSASFESWSNLFDGTDTTIFRPDNSKSCDFTITFPYPVVIKGCAVTGNQITWSLDGGQTRLLDSTGAGTLYTSQTNEYSTVRFQASTDKENLEISDLKLFNQIGDFIPRIRFVDNYTTYSTKDQWLYGGNTTGSQYIDVSFPGPTSLQTIEFTGASLPSNVVVTSGGLTVCTGDSYFRSIYTFSDTTARQSYRIYINRIVSNILQNQRVDINDIIFKDLNGYQVTPRVFPSYTLQTPTRITYTLTTSTRKGFKFTNPPSTSQFTIDKLTSFTGYRGKFIGVREMRVMTGSTVIHSMEFKTPFTNTFSYSNTSVTLVNGKVTFDFVSTFENYDRIQVGNFNIYNTFGDPHLSINVSSTVSIPFRPGGGCTVEGRVHDRLIGEAVTFSYPSNSTIIPSQSARIATNYPVQCIVLGTNDLITYERINTVKLEYGTYICDGAVDMFIGGTTQFLNNQTITLRFPRAFLIENITMSVPIDFTTTRVFFNTDENPLNISPGTTRTRILNLLSSEISLRCVYTTVDQKFSIGLNNILLNGFSLGEFGIVDGNIITYVPPNTVTIPFGSVKMYKKYMIKTLNYYNDTNSGDGKIQYRNTSIFTDSGNDFFSGFTENTFSTYGFKSDESVPANRPVWIQMDLNQKTLIAPDTFEVDDSYCRVEKSHLEVYDGSQWQSVTGYPISGYSFRRVFDSITNFKQDGRILIKNWNVNGYPSILGTPMTSNLLSTINVIEQPSFGTISTLLNVRNAAQGV